MKVVQFPMNIRQLFLQSATHLCTRLQAASPQIQETANLAKFESKTLYAADESQRLDVAFGVQTKPPCVLAARGSKALRS
jgi:hypothetical protein